MKPNPYRPRTESKALTPQTSTSLSEAAILELKKIYEDDFGEEITMEEAAEMGYRLIALYKILRQPLPGERKSEKASDGPALGPEAGNNAA